MRETGRGWLLWGPCKLMCRTGSLTLGQDLWVVVRRAEVVEQATGQRQAPDQVTAHGLQDHEPAQRGETLLHVRVEHYFSMDSTWITLTCTCVAGSAPSWSATRGRAAERAWAPERAAGSGRTGSAHCVTSPLHSLWTLRSYAPWTSYSCQNRSFLQAQQTDTYDSNRKKSSTDIYYDLANTYDSNR